MNDEQVEFEGTELQLGRTKYVVPPLSLGAVKKVAKRIENFAGLDVDAQMELTGEIAHLALKRNYPDITRERVDDLIDLRNMEQVFQAVVQVSGFTAQRTPPEGLGNGAGVGDQSTGRPSTPT